MNAKKLRKSHFETISGLSVEQCYSKEHLAKDLDEKVGMPGAYPFTRGVHDTMYRSKIWTMRQYAGFGTAKEANERYRYLLSQGTTGLSVAFDLPTQMGRDSDHALVVGEVGKVGVAISSVDDMKVLLDQIPLDQVSVSMTINATAAILLSFLLVVAEEQGVEWAKLRGTIQNDVLKEYVARGTYIYPPKEALRIITDIFGFCSKNVTGWNTISISGYHIREAGSTAVEEVAFTLADAIAYVQAAIDAGLAVDEFAPRLAFFFNCHNNFLEEVAKFRAARRMWAKIMKDRFGAKDPKSMMLRFHTQTAGSSLTAQQPHNNIMRTTLQALAAVFGGTQSLHTNSFDEALGLPTEDSALIALRTQQVIAYESGVADSVDPLAGSYLIESWTDRIEEKANEMIEYIDNLGGMVKAIEEGYPQRCIQKSAYDYQKKVESEEEIVVGVNKFTSENDPEIPVLKIDKSSEEDQVKRLKAYKSSRDKAALEKSLKALSEVVQTDGNIMAAIVECARSRATLGEISDVLRTHFGEYHESLTI
ncbi:MAG: methylmalonyl-CoA mutase [Deltaproteobacteria bacterium]|nr:methylmalonyl-CoA mutase [Deltaproteobacteria bacterium]